MGELNVGGWKSTGISNGCRTPVSVSHSESPIVRQHYRIYKKFTERDLTAMRNRNTLLRAEQSRAEQSRAEQSRAEQSMG